MLVVVRACHAYSNRQVEVLIHGLLVALLNLGNILYFQTLLSMKRTPSGPLSGLVLEREHVVTHKILMHPLLRHVTSFYPSQISAHTTW
jgi:hypothetical protein